MNRPFLLFICCIYKSLFEWNGQLLFRKSSIKTISRLGQTVIRWGWTWWAGPPSSKPEREQWWMKWFHSTSHQDQGLGWRKSNQPCFLPPPEEAGSDSQPIKAVWLSSEHGGRTHKQIFHLTSALINISNASLPRERLSYRQDQ